MVRSITIAVALLAAGCADLSARQGPMRAADVASNPPRAIPPPCGAPGVAPPHEICRRD